MKWPLDVIVALQDAAGPRSWGGGQGGSSEHPWEVVQNFQHLQVEG